MGLVLTQGIGYSSSEPADSYMAGWDRAYNPIVGGRRGMWWSHSAGAGDPPHACREAFGQDTVDQSGSGINAMFSLQSALASLLGPIMAGDQNGESWGNSPSQAVMPDGWTWMKANLGAKADSMLLGGVSMGGLPTLNFARANLAIVKAIILFYPCVSLQAQYNGTGGAVNESSAITTAYGGTPTWATYDPSNGSNPTAYADIPIYIGMSDTDQVVGTANQTAWINAVGASNITVRTYHNASHADMTQVNVNDVVSWIENYT